MTKELHEAKEVCREKVKRLADECRRGNRRFRDIEFDLIEDTDRCLYGLERKRAYSPLEARRVSQIFKEPRFIIEGATAGDIAQGDLENCWFLSALAVVASKNLIEEICVARDEDVGIYGFIFWRDSGWVNVIIDDLLFTKIPKWESLTPREQMIYHNRREAYNLWSRKGSKTLYFARSQTENETWVPLIEKAYAKLHGDYASLEAGFTSEAVEDLTGAVSTLIYVQDILNRQKFWEEELMHANNDRLFACFIPTPPATSVTEPALMYPTNGLIVGHAYSIIKVAEFANKKFLRIRNPWGETEWTGPWSDGSGEWDEATRNEARTKLDYNFGVKHKGEFVMEYDDFLETYEVVEKCRLFVKEGWKLSSQWLQVHAGHFPREWNYGDVSFTIDISEPTEAVIVLAQLDSRYFRDLASPYRWSLDFQLYKHNSSIPLASSIHSSLWDRSVKAEIKLLEPGSYVVHVRLDRALKPGRSKDETDEESRAWDNRKLSRKKVERALSMAIAASKFVLC
ncbi:hypothetical protein FRC03_008687 [Tulasnella sp. 419]|nr:hypothetical protein FRC02_000172 [Tulasnella sp. 418]KAG8958939.1 hypothetical protein FRC03_008687 [Tulasnella sp. 419]